MHDTTYLMRLICGFIILAMPVGGYVITHAVLGFPRFTMATDLGRAEIYYLLASAALACVGVAGIRDAVRSKQDSSR